MSSSLPPGIDDDDDDKNTGFVGLFDCASTLHAKNAFSPLLLLFANKTVFPVPSFLRTGCCCSSCSRSASSTRLATKTRSRASLDFPAPIILSSAFFLRPSHALRARIRALPGTRSFAPSRDDRARATDLFIPRKKKTSQRGSPPARRSGITSGIIVVVVVILRGGGGGGARLFHSERTKPFLRLSSLLADGEKLRRRARRKRKRKRRSALKKSRTSSTFLSFLVSIATTTTTPSCKRG